MATVIHFRKGNVGVFGIVWLTRLIVWTFSISVTAPSACVAFGQTYPDKSIRLVAPQIGGNADLAARLIAQWISIPLGQPVIVDNRASGVIPAQIVSQAAPDGYTLLVTGSNHWLTPLMQNVPYDSTRDFSPITLAVSSPAILVVHPSVAAKSVKELIALAKAKPGELNYGSTSIGAANHLSAELFKAMAGVNVVRVPYKGTGGAIIGVVTGEVQLLFTSGSEAPPLIKAGKLKALAVTSLQPSAVFPGLPTVAATVSGYEATAIIGIFAPAKTPVTTINRLNQEVVRVLNRADVKQKFLDGGAEVVGNSPEQFAAKVRSDVTRLGKVIKDANIHAD